MNRRLTLPQVQALLHADYSVCYVSAAKHLVDRQTIESLIGTDLNELEAYLKSLQQRLLERVYGAIVSSSADKSSSAAKDALRPQPR